LKVLHIQKIRTFFEKVFEKENLIAIPQKRKHKHTANRYTTTLESVVYFDEYYLKTGINRYSKKNKLQVWKNRLKE